MILTKFGRNSQMTIEAGKFYKLTRWDRPRQEDVTIIVKVTSVEDGSISFDVCGDQDENTRRGDPIGFGPHWEEVADPSLTV